VRGGLAQSLRLFSYAVVCVPGRVEIEPPDLCLVRPTDRGALVAVLDGAGLGAEAGRATRLAASIVEEHAGEGVIPLLRFCHDRLRGTPGAVISLVSVDALEGTLTWTGVGNVDGVLVRANPSAQYGDASIPLQAGVVGYRLPTLEARLTPIGPGDLLILTTDGIRGDFIRAFSADDQPRAIAEYISSNFRKGDDSRLVFVARYLGLNE
jgi:phosphoserine phosphatase RsbX